MSRYELSLTKDYVQDWTVVDAVRELFQNALDQEAQSPSNSAFWLYAKDEKLLTIGNRESVLDPRTLLLGASSKRDNKDTIGQFGEGYKIATLVLLRLGKQVTFYNYGAKEVWRPRFVKSRRYNGEQILTFFVDKKHIWDIIPDNNLTIQIEGISPPEYTSIKNHNLHLQHSYEYTDTELGRLLHNDEHKTKVFVNGLHVCNVKDLHYGYDLKPSVLRLGRDRKLVSNFDITWATSKLWLGADRDMAIKLIQGNAPDVTHMSSVGFWNYRNHDKLIEEAYDKFMSDNGPGAVPVVTQEEVDSTPNTHKPIVVSPVFKELITASPKYSEPVPVVKKTLRDRVKEWSCDYEHSIEDDAYTALMEILEEYQQ